MNKDQITNELEKISNSGINLLNSARDNGAEIKEDRWNNTPLDEIKTKTEDIYKEIHDLLESKYH